MLNTLAPSLATTKSLEAFREFQLPAIAEQLGQIVSAQVSLTGFGDSVAKSAASTELLDTVGRYGFVQDQLAGVLTRNGDADLLRGFTAAAGRRYNRYIDSLPERPIRRRATVARQAGDAQSGLLIAESLTGPTLDLDDQVALAEKFADEVLEPWQSGPAAARSDLFEALSMIESGLADWLKAAWEDIARDGPKAASKIANCTVECIDRALRAAAPNDRVLAWLAGLTPKPAYFDEKGRPTRHAKVLYVMRTRSQRDAALADDQIKSLITLVQNTVNDLQSVKHGAAPSITVMRSWVLTAESALSQLFVQS